MNDTCVVTIRGTLIGTHIRKQSSRCQASRRAKVRYNKPVNLHVNQRYLYRKRRRGINKRVKKKSLYTSHTKIEKGGKKQRNSRGYFCLPHLSAALCRRTLCTSIIGRGHFICKFSTIYIASELQ